MRNTRDRRVNDPAYIQWQKDYQAEQDATPEAKFKAAADADAEVRRQIVLTQPLSDEYLSGFGKVDHSVAKDEVAVLNTTNRFAAQADYVRSRGNSETVVDFVLRNNLTPANIDSFNLTHAILKLWNGYKDEVTPVETAPVEPEQVLSRSDQMIVDHQNYIDNIVGTDEYGKSWTEEMIDKELDAKAGLRLRRLFEKGHRGSSLYDVYREIKDIQQQHAAEKARRAQEEL